MITSGEKMWARVKGAQRMNSGASFTCSHIYPAEIAIPPLCPAWLINNLTLVK